MGRVIMLACALLAACRLNFDPLNAPGDAPLDGPPEVFVGARRTYAKASNAGAGDHFGDAVAMSADGSTLVVTATQEDSAAIGVGGDEASNADADSGAVYVFVRSGTTWVQQAYIKASNTEAADQFGRSVALSSDGDTLAVGANREDSNATGVGGDQANNAAPDSGAVYVFTRSGTSWSQQAYLKASNAGAGDSFGTSVALSSEGSTLAVGAYFEASSATGINGNGADDSKMNAGAAYVFTRAGATWSQQAYVKASTTDASDEFGGCVALSDDGNTMAVSAPLEDSAATGIDGDQTDNSMGEAGAAYVFTRAGTVWTQRAYVKASHVDLLDVTGSYDQFGWSLGLSSDGRTLAVGARLDASNAVGIDGDQLNNLAQGSGAVYVFTLGAAWSQQAFIKPSNTGTNDFFGEKLDLSRSGDSLVVVSPFEDSAATGIDGDPQNETAGDSGAAYLFKRTGSTWAQAAYLKATNTEANDQLVSVAISGDGSVIVLGALGEDGGTRGVGGDPADNSAAASGAIYIYQ